MKQLGLVLVLCGVAGLAAAPDRAYAFDIEGQNATLQDGASHYAAPVDQFFKPDFTKGNSLALPYIGQGDSGHVSDYGNSILIPGPGVESPAWTYSSPYFQRRGN